MLRLESGSYTGGRYKNEILYYELGLHSLESVSVISLVHTSD